jgi:hypothetical protein
MIRPRAWCAVLALTLVPVVAGAQSARNPFAGLFGTEPQRSGREFTSVTFRSTSGAQMGWALENEFTLPEGVIPEGISAGADAVLSAQYVRDRAQVIAQGRYSYQEYRQEPPFGAPAFDAGVSARVRPRTRLAFQGGANIARSPYFQLLWLAPVQTGPIAPIDRAAMLLMQNDSLSATAGIVSHYTRRSSLEVTGFMRQTDFAYSPQRDFSTLGGQALWRRQMSRDVAVRGGYGREQLEQRLTADQKRVINERVDVGIEYGRSLPFGRRTSFGFGTDTSVVRENDGPRHFRLNGNVRLEHGFARTWQVIAGARRGSEFLPGFNSVVFTDSGNAALAGYLSKRLILNVNAEGGQGQAGLSDARKFISYSASTKVTFALTRHFGVFTQYAYYHYQMPANSEALFEVPRGARQSVAIGVETWASIFDKDKVIRDPR